MLLKEGQRLSETPLDLADILKDYQDRGSGALVVFNGTVRDHHQGRSVDYLEFEAHAELAEKMIDQILTAARERWSLNYAWCVHRIGRVAVSESAIIILTASDHRDEAYAANRYIIDRVKAEVPVWKKETYSDGTSAWSEHP